MRRAYAVTLLMLGLTWTSSAQSSPDSSFADFDTYLRSELTRLRVPGAAVAVIRGDSLVHALVVGRADGSGRAITLETPFMIGSISKSMTALAMMQLVDAGRVALDSPVTRYLPWFHPTLEGRRDGGDGERVTIRQLLNQNGGIPAYAGRMDWAYPDTSETALERHARRLASVELAHLPGTIFEYANANYVLLGEVIQEVTRTSYERYLAEHVFGPLAMNHSFTSLFAAERSGMAGGFRLWFGHPRAADMPFMRSNLPAGQLIASAADMARYVRVHLNDGRYLGGTLLSPAATSELHRPASRLNEHWSYAMGWMSGTFGGRTVLWHNGLVPNFYAFVALVPERHEGIVILTNVGNVLDMPRLNRTAFGALTRLVTAVAVPDSLSCAMCPVSPLASESTVRALRPIAVALVVLQCCWIAWSVIQRRWRSRKGNVRSASSALLWAGWVFFALPLIAQMPPSVMRDIMPDLAAAIHGSVVIALAWAFARIVVRSVRPGRLGNPGTAHSGRSPS